MFASYKLYFFTRKVHISEDGRHLGTSNTCLSEECGRAGPSQLTCNTYLQNSDAVRVWMCFWEMLADADSRTAIRVDLCMFVSIYIIEIYWHTNIFKSFPNRCFVDWHSAVLLEILVFTKNYFGCIETTCTIVRILVD